MVKSQKARRVLVQVAKQSKSVKGFISMFELGCTSLSKCVYLALERQQFLLWRNRYDIVIVMHGANAHNNV